jgi:enterochelin esterase-like enzyme
MPPRPCLALAFLWLASGSFAPAQTVNVKETPRLTPETLQTRLREKPQGEAAEKLADDLRRWFGGADNLKKGPAPKVDGRKVAWAAEASGMPQVVWDGGETKLPLERVGNTDVYAAVITGQNGFAALWHFEVDDKSIEKPGARPNQRTGAGQLEVYDDQPELTANPDVPHGKLTQLPRLSSKIFEGTTRDWWVYVPEQYDGKTPAAVMVFQDGGGYKDFVSTVFDNLIAQKAMPVTVGVFVNPGSFEGGRSNRSFEYDMLSDQYARFLLEEVLPGVEKEANVKLRTDAAGRATAGISSGGICAWTVAWERPNEFSKVLSWVGSFTNIASGKTGREGGHNYEAMIRKTPRKPIRVFLQDGSNDLDNNNGNWPLANQTLAKSLKFAGYDYKFVYGQGFHSNRHGRAILPESLRWLWRGWESELPK